MRLSTQSNSCATAASRLKALFSALPAGRCCQQWPRPSGPLYVLTLPILTDPHHELRQPNWPAPPCRLLKHITKSNLQETLATYDILYYRQDGVHKQLERTHKVYKAGSPQT